MAGYIRQSTFVDGDTITAALFNNEYNQLVNAFSNTSGHKHDGTTAEGPVIGLIGDAGETSPNNKVLIDTTNNYIEFYVEVSSAPVQQLYIADGAIIPVTDSDIDLGTTSLRFKDTYTDTVTTTGNVSIGGDLTVTGSATISGNLTFGDADTDSINLAAEIDSDIIPNTDGTYDLGSATKEWQDLYIDGTANIDSLVADTADINGGTIDGATIATSDITVGAGKTLNVSAGTLTLADNQISGDKVEGGTIAATTITTLTSTTGNITNVNATTVDSTNLEVTNLKAKDGTSAGSIADTTGVVTLASSVLTTTDINGGTIDGVTIGGSSAGAVTFTDLSDGTITIAGFADEDNMVSDSATLLPTQQSVKAYVDSQVTAQDLDFQGDTGGALSIDLDSESLTIAGGTGIDTSGATNTLTVAIDSTVATLTGTQTLTNKTLTSPDVNTPDIDGGTIDSSVIGGTTPAAGTFTTLTANTSITGTLATAAQPNITSLGTLTGLTTTGDINFGDNDKAIFGAGSDLQIYHDGSNSYIRDAGDGDLNLRGDAYVRIQSQTSGTSLAHFRADAEVALYYNNFKKLETTNTGIDVTGTVVSDGLTVGAATPVLEINSTTAANLATLQFTTGGTVDSKITHQGSTGTMTIDSGRSSSWGGEIDFVTDTDKRMSIASNGDISFYDDTGTSQALYWDASAESLGIGTTSPNENLHVHDTTTPRILLTDSTTGTTSGADGMFLGIAGDQGLNIWNYENTYTRFAVNNAEKMRIDSSGNVGIGTSSPNSRLVVAASNGGKGIELQANTGSIQYLLAYDRSASDYIDMQIDGKNLIFATNNGTERMRIDSSGKVGIGTTAPQSKLETNLHSGADSSLMNANTVNDVHLIRAGFGQNAATTSNAGAKWGLRFVGRNDGTYDNGKSGAIFAVSEDSAGYNREVGLAFHTSSFDAVHAEKMRIDGSGNVGIGETSPLGKLHIKGSDTGATASAQGNSLILEDTENGLSILSSTAGAGYINFGDSDDNDVGMIIYGHSSNAMQFFTNAAERMRIDSSGNLKLSGNGHISLNNSDDSRISGDGDSIDFNLWDNTSSYQTRMTILDTGNVGIGTTSPGMILDVDGSGAANDVARFSGPNSGGLTFRNATSNEFIIHTATSDALIFGTNGNNERMRIDTSGNILAGKTSSTGVATGNIEVSNSSSASVQIEGGTNEWSMLVSSSADALRFYQDSTERMRIDSSGDVLIGQTSQTGYAFAQKLVVGDGDANDGITIQSGSTHQGNLAFNHSDGTTAHGRISYQHNSNYMAFFTNNSEKMRITSVGGVFIGTTAEPTGSTGGAGFSIDNNDRANFICATTGTGNLELIEFRNPNGTVGDIKTNGTSTTYNTSSDGRLKDVTGKARGLEVIDKLNPVSYNWKADNKAGEGLIAQEVLDLVPDAVSKNNKTDYYQMDYSKLVVHLIAGMKEQQTQIEALQSEINLLKGE